MVDIENSMYQRAVEEVDSQPSTNRSLLKLGIAMIGGSCFMLVSIMAQSSLRPASHGISTGAPTSLIGVRPSMSRGALKPDKMLCGVSPWKNLAITALNANNRRNHLRDLSMMASADDALKAEISSMNATTKGEVANVVEAVKLKARDMAGVTAPGFFDPLGFSTDCSTGKLLFYREVELKHGRVAMLASLGILVGEQFHPLFGGGLDLPAYITFQFTPLQTFWPAVVAAIAIPEVFSVFTFDNSEPWTMKADRVPGDFNFDPLGLKPTDPAEFKLMQSKEINNGRLAMIAAAGMIAQELATNRKIFDAPF